jgi:para-nitrobenzyl esterase
VWLYRFGYAHPEPLAAMGGAPHASELPYVFDSLPGRTQPKAIPAEQPVATLTHKLWVAFAKTGRPDGLPGLALAASDADRHHRAPDRRQRGTAGGRPYRARLDFVEQHIKP